MHTYDLSTADISKLNDENRILPVHQHLLSDTPPNPSSEPDQSLPKPPLRTHDIPISALPNDVSFTLDRLQRRLGFRNINNILPQIQQTSQQNFSISSTDQEPTLDLGYAATVDKSNRNTTPLTLPSTFGDIVHMDILYGSATAHGQIKYALYIIDRATRYKAIFPI